MSSFTRPVQYESIRNSRFKRNIRPFRYYIIDKHVGPYILVPSLFLTDGASIPKFLWPIFGSPFSGKHDAIAFVHDLLYQKLGWVVMKTEDVSWLYLFRRTYPVDEIISLRDGLTAVQFSKKACDKIFYDGCRVLGHTKKEAKAMYYGLRLFGGFTWKRYKKKWGIKHPIWRLRK